MITVFPFAFWSKSDRSGRSGTSWFFACTATRNHSYAAAIMAQEIYETRFKTIRALIIAAGLVGAYWLSPLPFPTDAVSLAAINIFALAIAMVFTGLYPAWQRELELRGQAIECAVRAKIYGGSAVDHIFDAADQLNRYSQFREWDDTRLFVELSSRYTKFALSWVNRNQAMINRAFRQTR